MIIDLINSKKNRFIRFSQQVGHCVIQVCYTCGCVYHKNERICFLDSDQHLFFYFSLEYVLTLGYKSTCINNVERFTAPFCHSILTVACYTANIVNDCLALFEQPVKKCAFPYIGSSYYCNGKSCHGVVVNVLVV